MGSTPGRRGWGFVNLVNQIEKSTERTKKFDPRVPPSFNPSSVKQVNKILAERSKRTPSRKECVQEKVVEHPDDLLPIHLRSEPLPQLSPSDILFPQAHGAANIVRRRHKDLANHTFTFRDQPARKKNQFIYGAAIESDGEGGDVPSKATTPAHSRASTPPRIQSTPKIDLSAQPSLAKKTKIKKVKTDFCSICSRYFDGPKQLAVHLKSKPHWKQVRNCKPTTCVTCGHFFTSGHNLGTHKCENFIKHPRF